MFSNNTGQKLKYIRSAVDPFNYKYPTGANTVNSIFCGLLKRNKNCIEYRKYKREFKIAHDIEFKRQQKLIEPMMHSLIDRTILAYQDEDGFFRNAMGERWAVQNVYEIRRIHMKRMSQYNIGFIVFQYWLGRNSFDVDSNNTSFKWYRNYEWSLKYKLEDALIDVVVEDLKYAHDILLSNYFSYSKKERELVKELYSSGLKFPDYLSTL